jgi:hypothetical protein
MSSNPMEVMEVHLMCLLCVTAVVADYLFKGVLPGVCVCVIVCDLETLRGPRPDFGFGATRK